MGEKKSYPGFLKDSGEAGEMIASIDWSGHALGPIDSWPESLRTTLSIILNCEFPMILFWNSDYICFYNDAYLPFLDRSGKHPQAMGQKADYVWEDSWEMVKPRIDRVLEGETAHWDEDHLLVPGGSGISEAVGWNYDWSPVSSGRGTVAGVLVYFRETQSFALPDHGHSEEIIKYVHRILESITDGFFALDENWVITRWNREAEKLSGVKRKDVIGEIIWDVFPAAKELKFYSGFHKVMKTRKPISFEEYFEPLGKWYYVNVYPCRIGISVYFRDITEQRRLQVIHARTEEISGVAGWEFDVASQKVFLTSKAYDIYGLPEERTIDLETNEKLFDEQSLNRIEKGLTRAIEKKKSYELELNMTTPDGVEKVVRINGFPEVKSGKVTKLYGTLKDITKDKKDQAELKRAYEKLKTSQRIAKLGYWTHDITENKSEWSEEVYAIWEQDPKTFKPDFENMLETVHPDDKNIFLNDVNTAFPDQNFYDTEHRIITPSGKVKWVLQRITLHRNEEGTPEMLEGIAQDISDHKRQEKEIREALKEKETLLAEVHHRVKNNLAVVSGLMQLQAYEEESDVLKEKLLDSVSRIVSMASIHEQLYQSNSFSKLDFSGNLEKLGHKIVDTMQVKSSISLSFDLDPVQLNVNQAIPLSLIVNEVVTNILKHAFKDREKGKIAFKLSEKGNRVELLITDNGVGMPEDFDLTEKQTLGLRLIKILVQQLEAEYRYGSSESGTVFSINFKKSEIKGIGSINL